MDLPEERIKEWRARGDFSPADEEFIARCREERRPKKEDEK